MISGKKLCKLFESLDYFIDHQTGSHIILRCEKYPFRRVTVPNHKVISKGTLRSIMREVGITIDEFNNLVKNN